MRSQIKMVMILLPLIALGLLLGWGYGLNQKGGLRLAWLETTRRKLLLYDGVIIELFGKKQIEQTFVANYPGLAQIDILFRENVGLNGRQQVVFHLKDTCASEKHIFQASVDLPPLIEPTFYPFAFPPLDDSAGRPYCLVLEAPAATQENAIRLQLSQGDLYPHGQSKVHNPEPEQANQAGSASLSTLSQANDRPYKVYLPIVMNEPVEESVTFEDIGFLLHYNGLLLPTIQRFIVRLTANKPFIWGTAWFYEGLVMVYIGLLVALFHLVRKTIQLDQ
jgi:hypothetical protein